MRDPGFYSDVPEADYHADRDSLSVSGAKTLLKAPALFRWQQDNPVHKDVFDIGSAAHAMVLGVGAPIRILDFDSWRSKAAQEMRDLAREEGHVPLLIADARRVNAMAKLLQEHPLAMRLLDGDDGEAEVSAYCPDETTGVMRRARFDWLADGYVVDYKTTTDADPSAFASSAARFDYAMQAAWYLDIARDLGRDVDGFAFIVQAKEPPYAVSVCELDWASEELGRRRNRSALDLYAACVAADDWPAYGDGLHTISLPKWAFNQEEIA
jgi:hypothetical protein